MVKEAITVSERKDENIVVEKLFSNAGRQDGTS